MTLEKRILDKIKSQGVRPTAKGYFKARDYVLWLLLGVFVAALGVGASMVIFMARGIDRGLFARLGFNVVQKLFYSVPYFWVLATIVVAVIAFINFRRTRRGYRLSTKQIVIITVVGSAAFGSIIYGFNVSRYIDQAAAENIPLYSAIAPFNTNTWFSPDHGLLSGSVKIKTSNDSFTLRDPDFNLWTITGKDIAIRPENFKFESGDRVKIIGKKIGDFKFQAFEIRPWETVVERTPRQFSTSTGPTI